MPVQYECETSRHVAFGVLSTGKAHLCSSHGEGGVSRASPATWHPKQGKVTHLMAWLQKHWVAEAPLLKELSRELLPVVAALALERGALHLEAACLEFPQRALKRAA